MTTIDPADLAGLGDPELHAMIASVAGLRQYYDARGVQHAWLALEAALGVALLERRCAAVADQLGHGLSIEEQSAVLDVIDAEQIAYRAGFARARHQLVQKRAGRRRRK
ncbi:hypothetical protein RB608_24855 [Nocardioides sp. LHD-245]|uniref:hypothetical protein n=1 Tax=Nocardioides sp. LHD-245 TaxID=3051387 RepID=UPI0027DEAF72|nr:hypothetical protein [Nocardioides sp. LHD-245]